MYIETERLIIRPFHMGDLGDFYAYASQPEVGPNAGWKPHESLRESKEILERFCLDPREHALVCKEKGKTIGAMGVYPENYGKSAMIGYVLNRDDWGRGLMTEAVKAAISNIFTKTDIENISIRHFPLNLRSRRIAEKCGLTLSRIESESFLSYDKTRLDEYVWEISKPEWEKAAAVTAPPV